MPDLTCLLARRRMSLSALAALEVGHVVTLDVLAGQPCELHLDGRLFAFAEVVVDQDALAARLTELVPWVGGEREPGTQPPGRAGAAQKLAGAQVELSAQIGRVHMPGQEAAHLHPGVLVRLNRRPGDEVDLLLNGRAVARGKAVCVGGGFGVPPTSGVRITAIVDRS
ncbi:MAG: FliM/FliN family flagellar motor switch protein [Candidatus Latescibacterota bacterium]